MSCLDSIIDGTFKCSDTGVELSTSGKKELEAITEANGKVIIAFKDGSYISGDMSLVDDSLKEAVNEYQSKEIKELKGKLEKLTNSLVDVSSIDGETSFKAVSKDYK